jgi:hypothetical protein
MLCSMSTEGLDTWYGANRTWIRNRLGRADTCAKCTTRRFESVIEFWGRNYGVLRTGVLCISWGVLRRYSVEHVGCIVCGVYCAWSVGIDPVLCIGCIVSIRVFASISCIYRVFHHNARIPQEEEPLRRESEGRVIVVIESTHHCHPCFPPTSHPICLSSLLFVYFHLPPLSHLVRLV